MDDALSELLVLVTCPPGTKVAVLVWLVSVDCVVVQLSEDVGAKYIQLANVRTKTQENKFYLPWW